MTYSQTQDHSWMRFRERLKDTWGRLTDRDIDLFAIKRDLFYKKLKSCYGIERDEAHMRIVMIARDCDYPNAMDRHIA